MTKDLNTVMEMLKAVRDDCTAQEHSLRQQLDVNWDCHDIGNWQVMADTLYRASTILVKHMNDQGIRVEVDVLENDPDDDSEEGE